MSSLLRDKGIKKSMHLQKRTHF